MPETEKTPVCKHCGLPVAEAVAPYDTLEGMHWVCYHYVVEHGDRYDVDRACTHPRCPSRTVDANAPVPWLTSSAQTFTPAG